MPELGVPIGVPEISPVVEFRLNPRGNVPENVMFEPWVIVGKNEVIGDFSGNVLGVG